MGSQGNTFTNFQTTRGVRTNYLTWFLFGGFSLVCLLFVSTRDTVHLPQGWSLSPSHSSSDASALWFHSALNAPSAPVLREKKKILFLVDFKDFIERMDRHQFDQIDAAVAHPDFETHVWGPEWGEWNANMSIVQNVEKRWGCGYFDWVAWTWPNHYVGESFGCGTLFTVVLGDCYGGFDSCRHTLFGQSVNISVTGYAFELFDYFSPSYMVDRLAKDGFLMPLFAHAPDCANTNTAYPRKANEMAKHDVVLFGSSGPFYELRWKVDEAIKTQQTMATRQGHPGYVVGTLADFGGASRPSTYDPMSPLTEKHRHIDAAFNQGLREAKICLFDSTMEKKMIRKYSQAMLNGCVIASDLPSEMEEDMREFIIYLNPEWPIEKINEVLTAALADPESLAKKAAKAYKFAIDHLQCSKFVERLDKFADMYRNGVRGYNFPYGFSAVCRQYHPDEEGPMLRPPWCSRQQALPDTI